MCCDETSDNRINHLHERVLRTVYNDNVSTFEKRLEKDNSETILFFIYIYIYINYITHCKIKKDNHQVPKIVRVPRNKINPKKIRLKICK